MQTLTIHLHAFSPGETGPSGFAAIISHGEMETVICGGHPHAADRDIRMHAAAETTRYLQMHHPDDGNLPTPLTIISSFPPSTDVTSHVSRFRPCQWIHDATSPQLSRCQALALAQQSLAHQYGLPWSTASMPLHPSDAPGEQPAQHTEHPQPTLKTLQKQLDAVQNSLAFVTEILATATSFPEARTHIAAHLASQHAAPPPRDQKPQS